MKVLFIDTENEIEEALKIKADKYFLLNPTENWKDTDLVKTTPACYSLVRNAEKFGQIKFEARVLEDYKVYTKNPESFIIYQDVTFGNMLDLSKI